MKRAVVSVSFLAAALALLPMPAAAQTANREPVDFRHATTLAVFGGGAVETAEAGPVAGGTLGWQVSRSVAVEGFGRWYYRGSGSNAFAAALLVQTDVLSSGDARVFVSGGLGMYHIAFGPDAVAAMPGFYSRRLAARPDRIVTRATFTDPAVVVGGGLKFAVTRHVSLRPALDVTIVPVRSRYHHVTTLALSLAYRFEQHPVTAARRWK